MPFEGRQARREVNRSTGAAAVRSRVREGVRPGRGSVPIKARAFGEGRGMSTRLEARVVQATAEKDATSDGSFCHKERQGARIAHLSRLPRARALASRKPRSSNAALACPTAPSPLSPIAASHA
eukprot:361445-Chlamydomonas_euryale.AAC.6